MRRTIGRRVNPNVSSPLSTGDLFYAMAVFVIPSRCDAGGEDERVHPLRPSKPDMSGRPKPHNTKSGMIFETCDEAFLTVVSNDHIESAVGRRSLSPQRIFLRASAIRSYCQPLAVLLTLLTIPTVFISARLCTVNL
jgi:hypothetical protein